MIPLNLTFFEIREGICTYLLGVREGDVGGKEESVAIPGNMIGNIVAMEMSCVWPINVSILVVILYYSFARCYHWGAAEGYE